MIIEFLLMANLVWIDSSGKQKSESIEDTFASHKACTDHLLARMSAIQEAYGVSPVPLGTELCAPVKRAPISASERLDLQARVSKEIVRANSNISALVTASADFKRVYGDAIRTSSGPEMTALLMLVRNTQIESLDDQKKVWASLVRDLRAIQFSKSATVSQSERLIDAAEQASEKRMDEFWSWT